MQAAVSTAVEGLGQYLRDYARKELPRQAAMHATAKELADTGARLLQIVRGEDSSAQAAQAAAPEAVHANEGSEVAVIGQGWSQACVGMQGQHQALLASLADIEQHALDMQQLMLKDAASVTRCMCCFVSLTERKPNQPAGASRLDAAPSAKELQQQCAAFRFAVDTLLQQARERGANPDPAQANSENVVKRSVLRAAGARAAASRRAADPAGRSAAAAVRRAQILVHATLPASA